MACQSNVHRDNIPGIKKIVGTGEAQEEHYINGIAMGRWKLSPEI